MKRKMLVTLLVLVVSGAIWWFVGSSSTNDASRSTNQTSTQNTPATVNESEPSTIRFIATGDMIPHDTVNLRSEQSGSQPYLGFFENITEVTSSADLMFCNQEAPSGGEDLGISGYPSFNAPIEFPQALSSIGCNIISLANNHTADRGAEGISGTLDVWNRINPYAVAGANTSAEDQAEPAIFDFMGKTFAFVAFTEFSNNSAISTHSVNIFNLETVQSQLAIARQKADFIIASAHWGVEDQEQLSDFQLQWAQTLADEGVDLIIGTGPHVLQTTDILSGRNGNSTVVYYSLGNALSTQLKLEELVGGFAVLEISLEDDVKIVERGLLPVYMHYEWTAAQAAAEDLLARDKLDLFPLDKAEDAISRSLFSTSVQAQTSRIDQLINQNATFNLYKSDQL